MAEEKKEVKKRGGVTMKRVLCKQCGWKNSHTKSRVRGVYTLWITNNNLILVCRGCGKRYRIDYNITVEELCKQISNADMQDAEE